MAPAEFTKRNLSAPVIEVDVVVTRVAGVVDDVTAAARVSSAPGTVVGTTDQFAGVEGE